MTATVDQIHAHSFNAKPLWIAVGALGATVLAMGAALVVLQGRPIESRITPMPGMAALQTEAAPASVTTLRTAMKQDESEKPVAAPVKKAPIATKHVAIKHGQAPADSSADNSAHPSKQGAGGHMPVLSSGYPAVATEHPAVLAQSAPAPIPAAVRPVCGNCGTVESATPIQRDGAGTGLGAVTGGVLGAVVGSQVGGGNGRAVAAVLGALGGGWAGNTVEKKMKQETLYQVRVRMEDGGRRTFEVATPVSAGSHVTVEGGSLRMADGSLASPLPARPQRQTQSNTGTVQTGG